MYFSATHATNFYGIRPSLGFKYIEITIVVKDLLLYCAAENNQTGKSKQGRGSLAIIVPLVTIGCLIIGALGYIFRNRVKKQGNVTFLEELWVLIH